MNCLDLLLSEVFLTRGWNLQMTSNAFHLEVMQANFARAFGRCADT